MSTLPKPTSARDIFAKSTTKLGAVPAMACSLTTKQPDVRMLETYGHRVIRHDARGQYQLALTLLASGHVLSFECPGAGLHEVVTPGDASSLGLLSVGSIMSFPCPNEKDIEHRLPVADGTQVRYICSMQSEVLPEGLYHTALREMHESGRESHALMRLWSDGSAPAEGRCLSMLDAQRYAGEVHIQSYHFLAATGFVLRMQTIFELAPPKQSAGSKH